MQVWFRQKGAIKNYPVFALITHFKRVYLYYKCTYLFLHILFHRFIVCGNPIKLTWKHTCHLYISHCNECLLQIACTLHFSKRPINVFCTENFAIKKIKLCWQPRNTDKLPHFGKRKKNLEIFRQNL